MEQDNVLKALATAVAQEGWQRLLAIQASERYEQKVRHEQEREDYYRANKVALDRRY